MRQETTQEVKSNEPLVSRWKILAGQLNRRHGRFLSFATKHLISLVLPGAKELVEAIHDALQIAIEPEERSDDKLQRFFSEMSSQEAEALFKMCESLQSEEMRRSVVRLRSLEQSGASSETIERVINRQLSHEESLRSLFESAMKLERGQEELLGCVVKQQEQMLKLAHQGAHHDQRLTNLEEELSLMKAACEGLVSLLYQALPNGQLSQRELGEFLSHRQRGLEALSVGDGERLQTLSMGLRETSSLLDAEVLPRLLSAGKQLCQYPPNLDEFSTLIREADVQEGAQRVRGGESISMRWEQRRKEITTARIQERERTKHQRGVHSAGDRISHSVSGVSFHERVIPGVKGGPLFAMGETQVTQALYRAVTAQSPSHFKGDQLPVEKVSWEDGIAFCNALSEKLKLQPAYRGTDNNCELIEGANGFRLPFEKEWQWAAKGGQSFKYAGNDNLKEVGWYRDNSGKKTHPVGQKTANRYSLFDMSGNVWEWCADDYANPGKHRSGAGGRVNRGGSWNFNAGRCRLSGRGRNSPDVRNDFLGLRLSRSLA